MAGEVKEENDAFVIGWEEEEEEEEKEEDQREKGGRAKEIDGIDEGEKSDERTKSLEDR